MSEFFFWCNVLLFAYHISRGCWLDVVKGDKHSAAYHIALGACFLTLLK